MNEVVQEEVGIAESASVEKLVDLGQFDLLYYNGGIDGNVTAKIENLTRDKTHDEVRFVLVTNGGLPDDAYRAMRILQRRYAKVTILIPGMCKSAGTLMTLGAHELAFGPEGELGPLDVQIQKRNEIRGRESGAAVIAAMDVLHQQCFSMFEHFFLNTIAKSQGNISAKMATDIAASVSSGVYDPIFRQIDPHRLGETQRAMLIGEAYGSRLITKSGSTTPEGVQRLITGYPSHGFVIDEEEASEIFFNVRPMSEFETGLTNVLLEKGTLFFAAYPFKVSDHDPEDENNPSDGDANAQEGTNDERRADAPGGDAAPVEPDGGVP
ncbi:SDH family Clp fold serine proteinase [Stenotrophomonas maltophilia]|uniref:SDH family Clp fold serine proteinase n=1 Tax=Stenotrophomonas maltophilia TaxID=40324 RepID=UPI000AA1175C|nr:SppA protein [Stenotrophomonas maltophilia]